MATKNKVKVSFDVEFYPTGGLEVPRLVGSIPELGSWNNMKGLDAVQTERENIWSVEVELLERSFFFFSWSYIKNELCIQKETGTGLRSISIDSVGGIIKTVFGSPGINFRPHGSCRLFLKTNYYVNHNEILGIVGSGNNLGNWRRADAIMAVESSCKGNWEVVVDIQTGVEAEFKWIIMDRESRNIKRWQNGENQMIRIKEGMAECSVFVPWIGRQLVIPEIKIDLCSDIPEQNYEPMTATIQPKPTTAPVYKEVSDGNAEIQPKSITVPVCDEEVFCKPTDSNKSVGVIFPICTEAAKEAQTMIMAKNIKTDSSQTNNFADAKMPMTDKGRQLCQKIWNVVCDFCIQTDYYLNMLYI